MDKLYIEYGKIVRELELIIEKINKLKSMAKLKVREEKNDEKKQNLLNKFNEQLKRIKTNENINERFSNLTNKKKEIERIMSERKANLQPDAETDRDIDDFKNDTENMLSLMIDKYELRNN